MKNPYFNFLLYPFAKIYELISNIRLFLYKINILKQYSVDCKIISIGNLTLGGTGKTPHTIYFAQDYLNKNYNVTVLSRGYKRKSNSEYIIFNKLSSVALNEIGDEPYLMAHLLPQINIIVGKDRYKTAKIAVEKLNTNLIILDDGYQHLRLKRDENILLIDYNSDFTNLQIFPQGSLRESFTGLNRASKIIITKIPSDYNLDYFGKLVNFIHKYNSHAPILKSRQVIKNISYNKSIMSIPQLQKFKTALLFSGIANENNFIDTVKSLNINILQTLKFHDHHWYNEEDLKKIESAYKASNAEIIITTAKDYLKIPETFTLLDKTYALNIEIEIFD